MCGFLVVILVLTLASVANAFEYEGRKLGSTLKALPKDAYRCSPWNVDQKNTECKKIDPGKFLGVPAQKVELMYKGDKLYIIFVSFAPENTPTIGKALEQRHGRPAKVTNRPQGTYQVKWIRGNKDLILLRQDKRGEASVTMIDNQ